MTNEFSGHTACRLCHIAVNNAPVADLGLIDSLGKVEKGQWVDIDVSSLINGDGSYSLRVSSWAKNGVSYRSKDAKHFAPQLWVTAE